jgi:cytochrome P450
MQTYISTSLHAMHHNPRVYPDPFHFKPERWLGERGKALDAYFAPFSRGGQSCIASKLAYYEMYIFLSILFSRFELDLFETSEATIDWTEHIVAATKKPVRVKIVAERW